MRMWLWWYRWRGQGRGKVPLYRSPAFLRRLVIMFSPSCITMVDLRLITSWMVLGWWCVKQGVQIKIGPSCKTAVSASVVWSNGFHTAAIWLGFWLQGQCSPEGWQRSFFLPRFLGLLDSLKHWALFSRRLEVWNQDISKATVTQHCRQGLSMCSVAPVSPDPFGVQPENPKSLLYCPSSACTSFFIGVVTC